MNSSVRASITAVMPARDRVGQRGVGLRERLGGRRAAHELRRRAELERQRGAQLRRGRLGLRALQVRERRVGRAALDRDRRRLAQPLDDPRVAARRREHQLRRDPLRRRAEVDQQPRRPLVLEPAPRGGQLEVDRVADQRVHEAERLVGAQDLGPHQRVDRLRGRRLVDPGERRRSPAGPGCSPSTATARATSAAGAGSRASRSRTVRDTARGPIARTDAACAASGTTCSAASAVSSWRSSSGLPAVTSWQAAANASSASPSSSETIPAVPSSVSGRGCTATVAGSCPISPSSSSSESGSPVRIVVATSTGSPATRRAR